MSFGDKNHNESKKNLEAAVLRMMQKKEYSLNTVNNYGDSLLHVSAANGCAEILKEVLAKNKDCNIDRKNSFGWTPLMQAIRNGNIDTVRLLLNHGASVNQSTYLGMSALGMAAAINEEMFNLVYESCPAALQNAANDDVTPLCVAAMKNDKKLFFKLLDLGLEVSAANEYTHLMMRQSTVPEIAALAKQHLEMEDYWNDPSDNIEIQEESDEELERPSLSNILNDENIEQGLRMIVASEEENDDNNNKEGPTRIFVTQPKIEIKHTGSTPESKQKTRDESVGNITSQLLDKRRRSSKAYIPKLDLLSVTGNSSFEQKNSISPNLSYNLDTGFTKSPNVCYSQNEFWPSPEPKAKDGVGNNPSSINEQAKVCSVLPAPPLQRLQSIRPSDIKLADDSVDLNTSLGYVPEFSPSRSPYMPPEVNDQDIVFGEDTPTPPHCKTPPRGMVLNSQQAKLIILLKQFDLEHHVPIFLEQEVDLELFLTLNNEDLREIGIATVADRRTLLEVIKECKKIQNT